MKACARVISLALLLSLILASCGGGSNPIKVSLASNSSSSTLSAGSGAVTISATISNDSKKAGVNFTFSPASGCGTLVASSDGLSATYTPPSAATLNADCTATITAASQSDSSRSGVLSLTIKAISVTFSNPPATTTLGAGAPAITLTAVDSMSTDTVTWNLASTGGNAPGVIRKSARPNTAVSGCGQLTPNGNTATYQPPAASLASSCTDTISVGSTVNPNLVASQTSSIKFTVNPITVALTPPASTVVVEGGTSTAITAALSNNGTSDSIVNWSVSPAGCGTVSAATGSSVTYKAPAPVPAGCNNAATVTAASDANPSATAAASFTITPIAVGITSPTTTPALVTGATQSITAATNDPAGVNTLKWTLAGCGSLSAATGSSITYTAPTSIAATCTPTVTVTSATDSTKTATLNITVNPITVSITSPTGAQTTQSGASAIAINATTNDPAGVATLNWSMASSPASPACGSLSATTGTSSNYTPPAMLAAQCVATVTVASKTDATKTATLAVTVNPAPIVVTITSPATGNVSLLEGATQVVTATIYNDATASGIGYALSPGSCGTFSGMALQSTSGATSTYTGNYTSPLSGCSTNLTLHSNQDSSKTAALAITVNPITVNITSPTGGQAMLSGASPLAITASTNDPAGAATLNWSLASSPSSPACGSLSASTGASVSYTPPLMLAASCSATVTVASQTDAAKTTTLAITVNPAPIVVTLISPSSGSASVGFGGTVTITATIYNDAQNAGIGFGPPVSSCGTFNGLTKQSTSGATSTYSGTYTAPQTACSVTINFGSPEGSNSVTVNITVLPGISVALTPAGPLTIDANAPLSITPTVTADSAGKGVDLTLSPSTGCGTLSAITANSGTAFNYIPPSPFSNSCPVSVIATSQSDGSKSATLALTVYPPLVLPAVSPQPSSLGSATQGAPYTGFLNATGGTGSGFVWTVTGLSNNLTSNAASAGSTLAITGTPTTTTSVTFSATVKDSTGTTVGPITYTIPVNTYTTVSLTGGSLPAATVGQSNYNAGINAVGGIQTYTFTVNSIAIPTDGTQTSIGSTGLFAASSGGSTLMLSGSPAGTVGSLITLNVQVTDGESHTAGPVNFTINVTAAGPSLSIDPTQGGKGNIPSGVAGQLYQLSMNAQGGSTPYTFTTVSGGTLPQGATAGLPPGLDYSPTKNILWGTPTAAGTYFFATTVTDNESNTATSPAVTIVIGAAPDNSHKSWLSGRYVCLEKVYSDSGGGSNGTSPVSLDVLSSIAMGNGSFSGVFDMSMGGGSEQGILNTGTVTGSVNVGSDNHGVMTTIASQNGNVVNTSTWAIEVNHVSSAPATEFHGIEIDDIGLPPSGQHGEITCYQATTPFTSGSVSGKSIAFALSGVDGGGMGKNVVGVVTLGTITGSSGNITAGETDSLKADGTPGNNTTFAGTYNLPSTFSTDGKYTVSLTSPKAQTLINYMIDANRGLMLEVDGNGTTGGGMMSGNVRTQLHAPYSNAKNLNGPFVMYYHSKEFGGSPLAVVDYTSNLIQGAGDGSSGATMHVIYQDQANVTSNGTDGGALTSQTNRTITLPVVTNGRAVFTPSGTSPSMYFYMYDNNSAFVMDGTEGLGVGWMEAQTWSGTSMGSSGGTTYIMFNMPSSSPNFDANQGMLTITGDVNSGTISGLSDSAGQGWFSWDESLNQGGGTITYTGPATVGTVTGEIDMSAGKNGPTCVAITSTKFVCIQPDSQPNINIMVQ